MNPYVILGSTAVLLVGGFTAGVKVEQWHRDSEQKAIQEAADKAGKAATDSAVTAIQGLRPVFTTINKGTEKEFHNEVRYTSPDCSVTAPVWSLLDRAYQAAGGEPFGDRVSLPTTPAAAGSDSSVPGASAGGVVPDHR